jgi:murein DD-endopeptidase MepM/ murein hydrolase activator NlpD
VDLDPQTLERVQEEATRIGTLLKGYRDERFWKGRFISPVEGEVTSPFGMRRILNGQERSPHTGVDLGVPEGTAVVACNHVVLVDELFFSGKTIVLDHGWGIYSMYSHLSRPMIKSGDRVKKGEVIALSGSTGRVTGPHLDWRIRLNGARVDPLSILQLAGHLEE